MPNFEFTAKDRLGNTIRGNLSADTMTQATSQVEQMGYAVLSVQAVPTEAPALQNPAMPASAPANPYSVNPPAQRAPDYSQDATRSMAPQPTEIRQQPTLDSTQVIPASAPKDVLADSARRMSVEADLRKLGMSPDEIRRLMNAGSATYDGTPDPVPGTALGASTIPGVVAATQKPAPGAKKPARAAAASLESFANELMSANASRNKQEVQNVNLDLPPFRESSIQEKLQAETLLRDANMLRRRERFKDAEVKCREALNLTPSDAAALEMLGDILQGVARTPEALSAYHRAVEADSTRASAEKKYADLLSRQQNWGNYDPEEPARSSWISVMMSALLPGAGQLYCGQWIKGAVFFIAAIICTYLLAWSPFGFLGEHQHRGISTSLMVTALISVLLYCACLVDAKNSAKQYGKRGSGSGWEV